MNHGTVELTTDRLILKISNVSFAEEILDYQLRNKSFFKQWMPIRGEDYYTLSFQKEHLEKDIQKLMNGQGVRFWLFHKKDRQLIGSIAFDNIIKGCFQSCFLGYHIDEAYTQKGYMSEALKRSIDFMFNELKLHRIEANIMPKNIASLKLVEKLGFHHEGLAKNYLKINGKWEDHIHMVLLNEAIE